MQKLYKFFSIACLQIMLVFSLCSGVTVKAAKSLKSAITQAEKSADLCTICREEFKKNNTREVLCCKQKFHNKCLTQWLNTGVQTCPLCRSSIADEKKFLKAFEENNVYVFGECLAQYPFLANLIIEPKTTTTILHHAAQQGKVDIVWALAIHKANLHVRNCNGETALHLAARFGHKQVISSLIKKGAHATCYDNQSSTPLHEAAANGWYYSAEKLIKAGARREAKTKNGQTPLLLAVINGHYKTAATLLIHGANPCARDNERNTVLWHAQQDAKKTNRYEILELVEKYDYRFDR